MTHPIFELYLSGSDFPVKDTGPTTEYMLATLPRSGSTYLATELWRTGMLGSPMEYLNKYYLDVIRQRPDFNEDGFLEYWAWVKHHRTSPNGVFGFKMFASTYIWLISKAPEWVPAISPDKVVFLARLNTLEQAISFSKAIRSRVWFSGTTMVPDVEYDFTHISGCVEMISGQLKFWSNLFDLTNAGICAVAYEDVLRDLPGALQRIAEFMKVPLDRHREVAPPLFHVQRNQQSVDWSHRYLDECGDDERHALAQARASAAELLARGQSKHASVMESTSLCD